MAMIDVAYVLLDANILLHYQPPDQIDWPKLCGARKVYLVIYPLLRTEVSNAKDMHPVKGIRSRARARESWMRERLAQPDVAVRRGVFTHADARTLSSMAR